MTKAGELDPEISKFVLEDFDEIVSEQQYLYKILCVDFSHVLARHSDYLFDDTESLADILLNQAVKDEKADEIEDLNTLDDFDDLEEI